MNPQNKKNRLKPMVILGFAIAAFPVTSFAELQWLDEASLSKVTGKAGLTIDVETRVSIAEGE